MRLVLLLTLAACGDTANLPPDAAPIDELGGLTVGPHGQAGFQLEYGDPTRVIAERSQVMVFVFVRSTAPRVATIDVTDPSILAIDKVTTQTGDLLFMVQLTAPGAGDTDLVLHDASGAEVDRMTFHVRPSDVLALPRPWGTGDALVLAGEPELVHVTTMTAGVVTAGTGAVQFTLSGSLSPAAANDAPWFFAEGDEVFFRADATGTGLITAAAPDATTVVNVSLVSPSALTSLTADRTTLTIPVNQQGRVTIAALTNGAAVYGARCTWSGSPLAISLESFWIDNSAVFVQSGAIGDSPNFVYSISGPPGNYTPTCTIAGLSTTISVRIQ